MPLSDLGCAELGIEFIQTNDSFDFGRPSNQTSRVPCDARLLSNSKRKEFGGRVIEMLDTGYLPREFRQYAKLARKLGLREFLPRIKQVAAVSSDVWVQRYCAYFEEYASH